MSSLSLSLGVKTFLNLSPIGELSFKDDYIQDNLGDRGALNPLETPSIDVLFPTLFILLILES